MVLGEDLLEVGDLLLRLVGPAQDLGKEELVRLNVAVDVDVVHALQLEKFV